MESGGEPMRVVEQILALGIFGPSARALAGGNSPGGTIAENRPLSEGTCCDIETFLKFSVIAIALFLVEITQLLGVALFRSKDKNAKPAATASVFVPDRENSESCSTEMPLAARSLKFRSPVRRGWHAGPPAPTCPAEQTSRPQASSGLSPDGAPIRYDWSAQLEKKATGKVDFADGTGKCSIDLGAASPILKDFKFDTPLIAVLDNNLYYPV